MSASMGGFNSFPDPNNPNNNQLNLNNNNFNQFNSDVPVPQQQQL